MKVKTNDIEVLYKRTKKLYVMTMDRITDRQVATIERYKELCRLAENLGYAVQHLNKFRGI